MPARRFRYEMYSDLFVRQARILEDIKRIPDEIGIPQEMRGSIGLLGGSGGPGTLLRDVAEAMEDGAYRLAKLTDLDTEIRAAVKDYYGDEYDAAAISTCEAALWVGIDVLMAPPLLGRGENYRARYVAPYERHIHHQAGYGRPFPPKYKDLYGDRGTTAGELGVYAKRQENLDVVLVPMVGARYECHGIKYHPTPLLLDVKAAPTAARIAEAAERHATLLSGFASLGYDTPGYGYGEKDADGTATLTRLIGETAVRYNVPFLVDNARGTPFLGTDPRKVKADLIVYSTDKAFNGPTGGLIIGREEPMTQVRRALGMQGSRWGTPSSHGKAGYVAADPGKEALLGIAAALKILREQPERHTEPVDELYQIVREEFAECDSQLTEGMRFTKSYNSLAVEINLQGTWRDGRMGVPIFPIEDFYSGASLLRYGQMAIGISPALEYDGNLILAPGVGTVDREGNLLPDRARYAVRALVRIIEIISRHAGVLQEAAVAR
jgi:hypothetical protein